MSEENETPEENTPPPKVFSLKRAVAPVDIEQEDGTILHYRLQEMMGDRRDVYLGKLSARMTKDDKGRPTGLKSFDRLQADLIAECLVDADGRGVPVLVIAKWRATVQKGLFELCQEMNGLTDTAAEKAKND